MDIPILKLVTGLRLRYYGTQQTLVYYSKHLLIGVKYQTPSVVMLSVCLSTFCYILLIIVILDSCQFPSFVIACPSLINVTCVQSASPVHWANYSCVCVCVHILLWLVPLAIKCSDIPWFCPPFCCYFSPCVWLFGLFLDLPVDYALLDMFGPLSDHLLMTSACFLIKDLDCGALIYLLVTCRVSTQTHKYPKT